MGPAIDPVFARATFLIQDLPPLVGGRRFQFWSNEMVSTPAVDGASLPAFFYQEVPNQPILYGEQVASRWHRLVVPLMVVVSPFALIMGLAVVRPRQVSFLLLSLLIFGVWSIAGLVRTRRLSYRLTTIYRSDTRFERLLTLRPIRDWLVLPHGVQVLDASGSVLGRIVRVPHTGIFRPAWICEAADGTSLWQVELVRGRGLNLGGIRNASAVLRTADSRELGHFSRKQGVLKLHSTAVNPMAAVERKEHTKLDLLDLRADTTGAVDRRLALAVMLMLHQ